MKTPIETLLAVDVAGGKLDFAGEVTATAIPSKGNGGWRYSTASPGGSWR